MQHIDRLSRRRFLRNSVSLAGMSGLLGSLPLPAWAVSGTGAAAQHRAHDHFDLRIGATSIDVSGRTATAFGINGSVPGPLLRFREGDRVTLDVRNDLGVDSSIHWHGLLLPTNMDGVPGMSFAGIRPGESYHYEFDVIQNGTYWYHSHSDLQEQSGVYGPIIIDPADADPVEFDREYVVLLSDWTFEDPKRVFANLKKMSDYYSDQHPIGDLGSMWSQMRMSPTDIADVTGLTYTYLLNGRDAAANWTGLFVPGERVRLRFINASAMTFFNVRIPDLEMAVVQADGQNVAPVA
ncbi:MAG: multicopper oxidase domain-containing protein, partial [Gammaproteobacteria bacterium]|nr:multicopper oxidase domain-containing protein [Gammaproteobacteria bacterium]